MDKSGFIYYIGNFVEFAFDYAVECDASGFKIKLWDVNNDCSIIVDRRFDTEEKALEYLEEQKEKLRKLVKFEKELELFE